MELIKTVETVVNVHMPDIDSQNDLDNICHIICVDVTNSNKCRGCIFMDFNAYDLLKDYVNK